jgi:hypothetical protein
MRRTPARGDDPYGRIDQLLARSSGVTTPDEVKNPFAFGTERIARPRTSTRPLSDPGPRQPPPPARPTLTSIVFDQDPRATVRYDGRDFSVRVNSLFADFRVVSITANQVVLDRSGEQMVLTLRPRGD